MRIQNSDRYYESKFLKEGYKQNEENMKKTQEIFLETYNNSGYKKGMASQALMEVMSRYDNFQNYSKKG